jgi:predicted transcriptional regulator
MSLARATITIPRDLLDAADRRATKLDRSRSWVLVDALRTYLREDTASGAAVREPAAQYVVGLGPSRQAQLEADLRITAEERARIAEETARVGDLRRRVARRSQVISFERLEDFYAWEKLEALDL